VCTDLAPTGPTPWLYGAIPQDGNSILIYFTNSDDPVDGYALEYGIKSDTYPWGATKIGKQGSRTYLVGSLSPGTTYYFRVRATHGCNAGTWSNEISATTKSLVTFNQLELTTTSLETGSGEETSGNCQTYTVEEGDTLWSIAKTLLGNGSQYTEISEQNQSEYPSLATSDSVKPGWTLKIGCETNTTAQSGTQTNPTSYKLKVKVTDTSNKPVAGAKVTLHSDPKESTTDKNGLASFDNVEPGQHQLAIAYNNYEGQQTINVTGQAQEIDLNITIQPKNVLLSPTVLVVIGIGLAVIIVLSLLLIRAIRKSRSDIQHL
jgi:LysM repeat protein